MTMRRIVTGFGDRNMEWAVFFGGQIDMFVKLRTILGFVTDL